MGRKLNEAIRRLESLISERRVTVDNLKLVIHDLKRLNGEEIEEDQPRTRKAVDLNINGRLRPDEVYKRNWTFPDDIIISYHNNGDNQTIKTSH